MASLILPPKKPFPTYKWRWASGMPTEGLNDPPVFLGVLRAFNDFEFYAAGSTELLDRLAIVQTETGTSVDLVRDSERNLIRNSGQYWKAFGLMDTQKGKIIVSSFGKELAEGKISQVEFATTIVKTLELPNRRIDKAENIKDWDAAGLRIKPLELILDVLADLSERHGVNEGYITPLELRRIVIPLAGANIAIKFQFELRIGMIKDAMFIIRIRDIF